MAHVKSASDDTINVSMGQQEVWGTGGNRNAICEHDACKLTFVGLRALGTPHSQRGPHCVTVVKVAEVVTAKTNMSVCLSSICVAVIILSRPATYGCGH